MGLPVVCPGCGSEVEAEALLCPYCGTSLPLEPQGGLRPIEDSAPDQGVPLLASAWETELPDERYLRLGEETGPGAGASPARDTPSAAFGSYCMECGATLPEGAEFCPVCGARAGETTAVVPVRTSTWPYVIASAVGLLLGCLAAWLLLSA